MDAPTTTAADAPDAATATTTEPFCATASDSAAYRVRVCSPISTTNATSSPSFFPFSSNNPFAPSTAPSPTISTPTQPRPPAFNLGGTYDDNNHSTSHLSSLASSSPVPSQSNPYNNHQNHQQQQQNHVKTKKELGANEQHLANLFANRDDGMDTFGNVGNMRCARFNFYTLSLVWLTELCVRMCRYGQTEAGRLIVAQKTGTSQHNPFAHHQQQPVNNERPFFDI